MIEQQEPGAIERNRTPRQVLALAVEAISRSDREHPADQVLRDVLKRHRKVAPEDAARVVQAVFSFFRWRGWLDEGISLSKRIEQAAHLADQFARAPAQFGDEDLAARAVPAWAHQEMDIAPAWIRSLQSVPRLWLRARRGQGKAVAENLGHCQGFADAPLADTLEYLGSEDLFRTTAFHAGEFEVQDISSQAVSWMCAPNPGETWWDACAGEGGKALHLSSLMENRGLIWATDRAAWRLQQLKRRAARAGVFNYRSAIWLGGPKLPTKTRFDGALVDAPCSGIGTWQRNPHARWTTTPEDVKELAELQHRLLTRTATAVKPGGRLVYSVCTLARSETTDVADRFEKEFPEFAPMPVPLALNQKSPVQSRWWIWPQEFGGNGMFVAVWQRR